ncbi:HDOD domain-containing protein [Heliobacterium gestii]|uniref:HDOD domain-containing protein n=1 Tax=Heliomicrobium gestii TaxID=2699 RepID=A0A845L9K8_HELGE|nr:HDOD domain-containing protein [Heliomicrobium gestii]MBM7867160.1 EAL and modified HD-GYP domain-containing signal transduction protein [Heliomicrobium gestii]MZP43427.1 HDOD domain-containing protein [Heliomicrobium gestii]
MQIFLARQPIYNGSHDIVAYELLFRSGIENVYKHADGDYATKGVISDAFSLIGIQKMTGGKPAFINFTRNLLLEDVAFLLPKDLVVLEVLENVEPDKPVIDACIRLKMAGYKIALDDFVFEGKYEPLIDLADIIKVDFLTTPSPERAALVKRCARRPKMKFLAERVENLPDFKEGLALGYTLFQGYFFSKPEVISSRDLPHCNMGNLSVVNALARPNLELEDLEDIIKRDVSLTYKLLKFINSSLFGFSSRIESIRHAISLLGKKEVTRWVTLITFRQMCDISFPQLLETSLLTAKCCELLAPHLGLKGRASDLFLLGLFSVLDVLFNKPYEEILTDLPIAEDIKQALCGEPTRLRWLLLAVQSYRDGDWAQFSLNCARLSLAEDVFPTVFLSALDWVSSYAKL